MEIFRISRLNRREWIETENGNRSRTAANGISRLNRREWIETSRAVTVKSGTSSISRLNRREWIETDKVDHCRFSYEVSPGLIAGSGLKLVFS